MFSSWNLVAASFLFCRDCSTGEWTALPATVNFWSLHVLLPWFFHRRMFQKPFYREDTYVHSAEKRKENRKK
jgi:hypothetical protein